MALSDRCRLGVKGADLAARHISGGSSKPGGHLSGLSLTSRIGRKSRFDRQTRTNASWTLILPPLEGIKRRTLET